MSEPVEGEDSKPKRPRRRRGGRGGSVEGDTIVTADAEPVLEPTDTVDVAADEADAKPKRRSRAKKTAADVVADAETTVEAEPDAKPKRRSRAKKVDAVVGDADATETPATEPALDSAASDETPAEKPKRRSRAKKPVDAPVEARRCNGNPCSQGGGEGIRPCVGHRTDRGSCGGHRITTALRARGGGNAPSAKPDT